MNKILTQTGGQPVFLDDIDFSSQATRDAFKALCRALSLDDCRKNLMISWNPK